MESMTDWAFSWPISKTKKNFRKWIGNIFWNTCIEWAMSGRFGLEEKRTGQGRTLIVIQHISLVVATAVVSFAHTHRVMGEVDIAIIA